MRIVHTHVQARRLQVQTKDRKESIEAALWEGRVATAQKRKKATPTERSKEQVTQRRDAARQARLEALRAQIAAGTYHVDSKTLAEDMLKNQNTVFPESE